jgi:Tol biopolymer transport system component
LNYSGESSLSRLTWSPDGRKLAFTDRSLIIGASAYPALGLCVLSADGRRFRRINIPTSEIGALAWSPDARRIAVAANRNVFLPGDVKERRADIWVVDVASGRARKLAPSPGDVTFLSWSPNGQRLLFTSRPEWDRNRAMAILVTADGRRRAVLSREPADTFFAAWSPDGTRLVFSARAPGDSVVLEVARSSGKGRRRLWRCRTGDQLLGVSWPARERVLTAVMAGIAGSQRGRPPVALKVDAIDPRTGKARVLARASEYPRNIAWSHHGRFIAYEASSRNRPSHIHRLDLRSGRVKRLTGAPSR